MPFSTLPYQTGFYRGKVRDVYSIGSDWLIMLASDRISAFDVILPRTIPFKGQVLNQIAAHMLRQCADICPNWLLDVPAPNVSAGWKCEPFKIEIVVRGTLTGHAWRTYQSGSRQLCGIPLPEGLNENASFPTPIITPSTKAAAGHDEDIAADEIIRQQLATPEEYRMICEYALALFERGQQLAHARGLILADTKYEFGKREGKICLMDEIHTPDSSRYFRAEGFEEKVGKGEKPEQLSKEFVREWLMSEGFMGQAGQAVPEMTDERVMDISKRYIQLYEKVTGENFIPNPFSEEETVELMKKCAWRLVEG
ncbi:MAG TPA: phosphoribosylaminoimidazolesuccinocarboxamide synthase [Ferruginibacter sp.]|nr:phosphoribosylaminoimidazolesuccinocarboxamide synthase [Ferruginibacter sp.]HRO18712.1 phosphoribosylaminoimidazolesuccinocarboxamide synthase [Ferruginibacter sp.]HRQ21401.1 phosphoribosylaminoimidazolesuccinocarboxamide synthase [Ferruginibacter sp.]